LIAFLFRDKLKSELDQLLEINGAAFPDAMSTEDKAERLAELSTAIDAAERVEAACIERIVAEGGTADHRANASVLAVLSLLIAD
jgi:hypothetical protein